LNPVIFNIKEYMRFLQRDITIDPKIEKNLALWRENVANREYVRRKRANEIRRKRDIMKRRDIRRDDEVKNDIRKEVFGSLDMITRLQSAIKDRNDGGGNGNNGQNGHYFTGNHFAANNYGSSSSSSSAEKIHNPNLNHNVNHNNFPTEGSHSAGNTHKEYMVPAPLACGAGAGPRPPGSSSPDSPGISYSPTGISSGSYAANMNSQWTSTAANLNTPNYLSSHPTDLPPRYHNSPDNRFGIAAFSCSQDKPAVFAQHPSPHVPRGAQQIDLFLDLHGHSQKTGVFFYGCGHFDVRSVLFPKIASLVCRDIQFDQCRWRIEARGHQLTARAVVARHLGVQNSFTVEASFFGCALRTQTKGGLPVDKLKLPVDDMVRNDGGIGAAATLSMDHQNSFDPSSMSSFSALQQQCQSEVLRNSSNSDGSGPENRKLKRGEDDDDGGFIPFQKKVKKYSFGGEGDDAEGNSDDEEPKSKATLTNIDEVEAGAVGKEGNGKDGKKEKKDKKSDKKEKSKSESSSSSGKKTGSGKKEGSHKTLSGKHSNFCIEGKHTMDRQSKSNIVMEGNHNMDHRQRQVYSNMPHSPGHLPGMPSSMPSQSPPVQISVPYSPPQSPPQQPPMSIAQQFSAGAHPSQWSREHSPRVPQQGNSIRKS
jgi:hypothetical protein